MTEEKLQAVLNKRSKWISTFAAIVGLGIRENEQNELCLAIYADPNSLTNNVKERIGSTLSGIPLLWIFDKPPELEML